MKGISIDIFSNSLFVELVILSVIVAFLLLSFNYQIALFVYIGYQITFMFGSYLIRGETLLLKKDRLLTLVDVAKQFGYLIGLGLSFLFYKFIEYQFQIIDLFCQQDCLNLLPIGH